MKYCQTCGRKAENYCSRCNEPLCNIHHKFTYCKPCYEEIIQGNELIICYVCGQEPLSFCTRCGKSICLKHEIGNHCKSCFQKSQKKDKKETPINPFTFFSDNYKVGLFFSVLFFIIIIIDLCVAEALGIIYYFNEAVDTIIIWFLGLSLVFSIIFTIRNYKINRIVKKIENIKGDSLKERKQADRLIQSIKRELLPNHIKMQLDGINSSLEKIKKDYIKIEKKQNEEYDKYIKKMLLIDENKAPKDIGYLFRDRKCPSCNLRLLPKDKTCPSCSEIVD